MLGNPEANDETIQMVESYDDLKVGEKYFFVGKADVTYDVRSEKGYDPNKDSKPFLAPDYPAKKGYSFEIIAETIVSDNERMIKVRMAKGHDYTTYAPQEFWTTPYSLNAFHVLAFERRKDENGPISKKRSDELKDLEKAPDLRVEDTNEKTRQLLIRAFSDK